MDPRKPLGKRQDVEELGAGSRWQRFETSSEHSLHLLEGHEPHAGTSTFGIVMSSVPSRLDSPS